MSDKLTGPARAVGNAVYLDAVEAVFGMPSHDSAVFVAGQINRAVLAAVRGERERIEAGILAELDGWCVPAVESFADRCLALTRSPSGAP